MQRQDQLAQLNKTELEGLILPDLKIYSKATKIKTG